MLEAIFSPQSGLLGVLIIAILATVRSSRRAHQRAWEEWSDAVSSVLTLLGQAVFNHLVVQGLIASCKEEIDPAMQQFSLQRAKETLEAANDTGEIRGASSTLDRTMRRLIQRESGSIYIAEIRSLTHDTTVGPGDPSVGPTDGQLAHYLESTLPSLRKRLDDLLTAAFARRRFDQWWWYWWR